MSLLASPSGHLTNLSTAPDRHSYTDRFAGSRLASVFGDNVGLMNVDIDLSADEAIDGLVGFSRDFYTWFDDGFDFLLFVSNLHSKWESDTEFAGVYAAAMNDVEGTGMGVFYHDVYGSPGRLRGAIHLAWRGALLNGPALHELFHAWGNYSVPTSHASHWGFSSANGQLGGFDRDNLRDLGNGQYAAGRFSRNFNGSRTPYSPIEMYFAGYIGPEDVPDLWVAGEGQWVTDATGLVVRTDEGYPVFEAAEVAEVSIEDIVEEHGSRQPSHLGARHDFRGAVVLLVDERRPVFTRALAGLSRDVSIFSHAGSYLSSPAWDKRLPPGGELLRCHTRPRHHRVG